MAVKTAGKNHLTTRLSTETIDRIKSISATDHINIEDLINAALDDYEIRKNDPALLSERVASLESALVEMITTMRPDWHKTRQLTSANWDAIHFLITGATNPELLKQWPKHKAEILDRIGLKKKEAGNENGQ